MLDGRAPDGSLHINLVRKVEQLFGLMWFRASICPRSRTTSRVDARRNTSSEPPRTRVFGRATRRRNRSPPAHQDRSRSTPRLDGDERIMGEDFGSGRKAAVIVSGCAARRYPPRLRGGSPAGRGGAADAAKFHHDQYTGPLSPPRRRSSRRRAAAPTLPMNEEGKAPAVLPQDAHSVHLLSLPKDEAQRFLAHRPVRKVCNFSGRCSALFLRMKGACVA
jgi:hypothetical protein